MFDSAIVRRPGTDRYVFCRSLTSERAIRNLIASHKEDKEGIGRKRVGTKSRHERGMVGIHHGERRPDAA